MIRRLLKTYGLRLERRGRQLRAWRKGRELSVVEDRTRGMPDGPILLSCMRNEAVRLPFFLDYYRRMGVVHFLFVDNASTDGSAELVAGEADVSVWRTEASYRASRFGVDWLNALLARHGPGRWILVADPDEFLVYPHCETRKIPALTRWLESQNQNALGTLLLDMYSDGPVAEAVIEPGQDPFEVVRWFDAQNYVVQRDPRHQNLWIQGGPRSRVFFADRPRLAPALNKIPLVRWQRGNVYLSSSHSLMPRKLNRVYDAKGGACLSGVLLHAKFTQGIAEKAREELTRREHYSGGLEYEAYHRQGGDVRLWTPQSTEYEGPAQLLDLGLMSSGGWL